MAPSPTGISRRTSLRFASALAAFTSATASARAIPQPKGGRLPATLSLNESSYGPAPGVADAIRENLAQLQLYVSQTEVDGLTKRIAAFERVSPDQVIVGDILGSLGVQLASARAGGGEFVYSTPGYTELIDAGAPLGGIGRAVPLNAALENDLPALAAAVSPRTLAVSLVNPHNPSGTVNDREAFDAFLRDVSQRTLLIVDEAYLEYDDFEQRSAVRFTRTNANVAVFRTFAKAYGLAGMTVGYVVAPAILADKLRTVGVANPHSLNRLSLVAAEAALGDQLYLAKTVQKVRANRARLHEALDALHVHRSDSRGNFVFFQSPLPAAATRAKLAGMGLLVGRAFPPLGEWIRITVGDESQTKQTISALQQLYNGK